MDSFLITNSQIIERFKRNQNNVFLVSFPRTGSHWTRMLMEAYFVRPALRRTFYYEDFGDLNNYRVDDFLFYHTHDAPLSERHTNVIYIYRNPVDTIYSKAQYDRMPLSEQTISILLGQYIPHINWWIGVETHTTKKTLIYYDHLKNNPNEEFGKISTHYGEPFFEELFMKTYSKVSKEDVLKRTKIHNDKAIVVSDKYETERKNFHNTFGVFIWEEFCKRLGETLVRSYFFNGLDDENNKHIKELRLAT